MPLFKLCPTKFENKDDQSVSSRSSNHSHSSTHTQINEELYLKSYNSSSSISSSQSHTDENHPANHVVLLDDECVSTSSSSSSSEKVSNIELDQQPTRKGSQISDFVLLKKFQTSFKEKLLKSEDSFLSDDTKSNENTTILEICVDCYQMMEGVTVDASSKQIFAERKSPPQKEASRSPSLKQTGVKSVQSNDLNKNLLKSLYLSKNTNREFPSSCSSDAITMISLSNVNIVHSATTTTNETESRAANGNLRGQQAENELSTIMLSDEASFLSAHAKNSKISRQNLTLDLQPVYTSKTTS